jgi:hypothetical protein
MAVYSTTLFNFHSFPFNSSSSSSSSFSHQFHFQNLKLKNLIPMSSLLPIKSPFHLPSNSRFNRTHPTVYKFRTSSTATNRAVFLSVTTVTLAVANRVLYKLALVPLNNYPFFLAQFTTFG